MPPRPNKHCTGPLIPHRRLRTARSTSPARHRQHHITGFSATVISTGRLRTVSFDSFPFLCLLYLYSTGRPRTACRSGSSAAVVSTDRPRTACRSGSSASSAAARISTSRPRTACRSGSSATVISTGRPQTGSSAAGVCTGRPRTVHCRPLYSCNRTQRISVITFRNLLGVRIRTGQVFLMVVTYLKMLWQYLQTLYYINTS